MRRRRQSTVEPVLGSLSHHYGLRRVNIRGPASAYKAMLLNHLLPQAAALALTQPHHEPTAAYWRGMCKGMNRKCCTMPGTSVREPEFCNSYN